MKKSVFRIAAASCFFLATAAPMAWAEDGMTRPGGVADRMFEEMDTNHDGVVTKKEFDAFHDKRFQELDANHDGKITREEMETGRQKMMGQMMREQLKRHFEEADTNHDGALSKEEAQKMPFVAQHFDEIDANHDGKVTLDEIEAAHKKMHGQGGMNCDGMHGDMAHCGGMQGGMMHQDGMMHPGGMTHQDGK